jgi:hypothetical protein
MTVATIKNARLCRVNTDSSMPRGSGRRLVRQSCLFLLLAATASIVSAGAEFEIRNPTIASGGSISQTGDLRLISTQGEPAMGVTTDGDYRLTSGFPATLGDAAQLPIGGPIFSDSFEQIGGN